MGILYRDFTPKPAYAAYATLTRILRDKKPAGAINVGGGTFAYRFSGDGGTVVALWNSAGDARVPVPVKAGKAMLVNTIGEAREIQAKETADVVLRKGAPVYLLTKE